MKLNPKIIMPFSIICFALINITEKKSAVLLSGAILVLYFVFFAFKRKSLYACISSDEPLKENFPVILFSAMFSMIFGMRFFTLWLNSDKLLRLCFNSSAIKSALLCAASVILSCGSYFVFYTLFCYIRDRFKKLDSGTATVSQSGRTGAKPLILILITSVIAVTLCSRSSPIYPLNNWDDANCFFTVGKAAANNMVLYKDIFEQKGPLLYFIHTLAYYVSSVSFTGVYLIEVLNCVLMLLIFYKTLQLFTGQDSVIIIPAAAAVIYSSSAFYMGDSAEELCLPCVALCNYFGLKALCRGSKIKASEWFVIGITASVVLWIKFSLLGFYIGFGLFFAFYYIRKKLIKQAFASLAALIAGIVSVSVPVFVYFIINGAVKDLFEVYFYDNLFLYTVETSYNKLFSLTVSLYYGFHAFFAKYALGFLLTAAGFIYLAVKDKKVFCLNFLTFAANMFFLFSGGRHFAYYSLILSIYIPFGIIPFYLAYKKYMPKILNKSKRRSFAKTFAAIAYGAVCLAAAFLLSSNTYMLKYSKKDLPQFAFAEIISQTENPTLLNYLHLDSGFYTVTGIVPNCKYFCGLNIEYDEIGKTQDYYIENGLTDYVVIRKDQLTGSQLDVYECVAQKDFETTKGHTDTYYLYKKR